MSKRKAEVQINPDNPSSTESGPAHDLKDATPEQLKQRKIVRARRRTPSATTNKPIETQSKTETKTNDEEKPQQQQSEQNGVDTKKEEATSQQQQKNEEDKEEKKEEPKKIFSFSFSKPTTFSTKDGEDKKQGQGSFKPFSSSTLSKSSGGFKFGFGKSSAPGIAKQDRQKWTSTKKDTTPDPKSQLKGAALSSGEENEETVHETRSKLYKLETDDKSTPSWKERGVGILKVNKNKETKNTRLLMRIEKSFRVILNLPIFASIGIKKPNDKSISLVSFNQEEEKPESMLLKFTTADACAAVLDLIEAGKKDAEDNNSSGEGAKQEEEKTEGKEKEDNKSESDKKTDSVDSKEDSETKPNKAAEEEKKEQES